MENTQNETKALRVCVCVSFIVHVCMYVSCVCAVPHASQSRVHFHFLSMYILYIDGEDR